MIEFSKVALRMGGKLLIEDFSFTLTAKMRLGIVGKNGTGKTTLFKAILGEIEPDQGRITLPEGFTIAAVEQEIPATDISAFNYILSGDQELISLRKKEALALQENNGLLISQLHEELARIDGYRADSRAYQLLTGLGFKEKEYHQSIQHFSGGWRMRLNIGKALMSRSQMLLLDEPTNHLDFETVSWLLDWLKTYPGILLLISHDTEVLNVLSNHILHFSQQKISVYTGNYEAYLRLKAEQLAHEKALFEKNQQVRAHLKQFVERFGAKASKAKQAQSRVKALERMENLAPLVAENPFTFSFKEPPRLPDPLIRLQEVSFSYKHDTSVLRNINLTLTPYNRYGILGRNGEGKSTLIKLLAGELALKKERDSGVIVASEYLKVGYFSQHQLDFLRLEESPLWHLSNLDPLLTTQEARNFLGRFGFYGKRVDESVGPFSGGEKARLALALIVYQTPNLLLLDEPTNHLDIEMREALALALQEFKGALIMVSHDASLLSLCCDEFLLINNQELSLFPGDLEDYREFLRADYQERPTSQSATSLKIKQKETKEDPKENSKENQRQQYEERRQLNNELRKLERERQALEIRLPTLEKKITTLNEQLGNPLTYSENTTQTIEALNKEKAQLDEEHARLEEIWFSHSERIEEIKALLD